MNVEDVLSAKTDVGKCKAIYRQIFYDKRGSPKLRKWLVKKGISYNKLNEIESVMNEVFIKAVSKYNYGKIDFEKYVWTKFEHTLNNHYHRNKFIKKVANEHSLDEFSEREDGLYEYLTIDNSIASNIDLDIDISFIINDFDDIQSFIFKCKYYNNWSDNDIQEYIRYLYPDSDINYENELDYIKFIIYLYIEVGL